MTLKLLLLAVSLSSSVSLSDSLPVSKRGAVGKPAPDVAAPSPAAIDSQRLRAESAYIGILEKTNQQLSMWWNPVTWAVSMLGVLFAIGAIIAGVLLYRQGREYKQLIVESIEGHKSVLAAIMGEKLKELESKLDQRLVEAKEGLKAASAEESSLLIEEIDRLSRQIEQVKAIEKAASAKPSYAYLGGGAGGFGPGGGGGFGPGGGGGGSAAGGTFVNPFMFSSAADYARYANAQRRTPSMFPQFGAHVCSKCNQPFTAAFAESTPEGLRVQCPNCGEVKKL